MSLGMRAASVQKDSRRTKLELSKAATYAKCLSLFVFRQMPKWWRNIYPPEKEEVAEEVRMRVKAREKHYYDKYLQLP